MCIRVLDRVILFSYEGVCACVNVPFREATTASLSLRSDCLLLKMKLIMEHGSRLLTPLCQMDMMVSCTPLYLEVSPR